jgi:thiamine-phosphate pyrophosphorylase
VGADLEVKGEVRHKDLSLLAVANARRAQESLRVLEEIAKLPEVASKLDSNKYKTARFDLYYLEQDLVSRLSRKDKVKNISGLYVILDTQVLGKRSHMEPAREVIEAGVKVIQLRAKDLNKNHLLVMARELRELCKQKGVLFIVNDYLDIALAVEADGLHIGEDDLPVEVARRLLPCDKILGCSASTVEKSMAADAAGADYIAVCGLSDQFQSRCRGGGN